MMKPVVRCLLFLSLLLMTGCLSAKTPAIDVQTAVQEILLDYSNSVASGTIAHPDWYSPTMQKLVLDRHAFYKRFSQVALHSDMTILSARFGQITIEQYDPGSDLIHVRASELVSGEGVYLSRQVCFPQAVYWASLHSESEIIKNDLMEYFDVLTADTQTFKGTPFDETGLSVSEHRLLIQFRGGIFQIIEDSYTDVNPQDNPQGLDVVNWKDGDFQRKPSDLTTYPDFQLYEECIEQNGITLLNEYKLLYGAD